VKITKLVLLITGKYVCEARNQLGEERVRLSVQVSRLLQIRLQPNRVEAQLGQPVQFNCSVFGHPLASVQWLRDGRPLSGVSSSNANLYTAADTTFEDSASLTGSSSLTGVRVLQGTGDALDASGRVQPTSLAWSVLRITKVTRGHVGSYQCVAVNELDNAQASVELKLGDAPPSISTGLSDRLLQAGELITMKCVASGSPLPQITWTLDGRPLPTHVTRFRVGDFVSQVQHEQVMSYVNITHVQSIDSGEYRCTATNELGQLSSTARLSVPGEPTLRQYQPLNVSLVEGRRHVLHCPLIAYPATSVVWLFNGRRLPLNHRHRLSATSLDAHRNLHSVGTLTIEHVQKSQDEGEYVCHVSQVVGSGSSDTGSATFDTFNSEPETSKSNTSNAIERSNSMLTRLASNIDVKSSPSLEGRLNVMVQVPPEIDAQPLPPRIYTQLALRVKLVCSVVRGDPPVRLTWLKNGRPLSSADRDSSADYSVANEDDYSLLTIRRVQSAHAGNYTCVAANHVQQTGRSTQLIVNAPPTWRHEPPATIAAPLASRLVVDCAADGWPSPVGGWKRSPTAAQSTGSQSDAYSTHQLSWLRHPYSNGELDVLSDTPESPGLTDLSEQRGQMHFRELLSGYRHQVQANGSLIIQELDQSDAGYFMCQLSNGVGAGLSKVMLLKVNSKSF
jgi:Down syndrome cell adhesion protein